MKTLTNKNRNVNLNVYEVDNSYSGLHLHPEHLADLRKSGLSDQTILQAKILSVRPYEIERILSQRLAKRVDSLLAFPYPGNGFVRYKLFPSIVDKDGHRQRYFQAKGSGVHLYFPPGIEKVLSDPSIPLTITEGEKKSLRANEMGIPCVGLGGVWSWCKSGSYELISDFDKIALSGREVNIVFDSPDIIVNSNVSLAAHRLAKALTERGAIPYLVVLPPKKKERGGDEEIEWYKVGVDEYLCEHSVEEFRDLKRILLTEEMIEKELISQLIHKDLKNEDVSTVKSPSSQCKCWTIKVFDLEGDSTKTLNFPAPCRRWDCPDCYPYLANHWLEIISNNYPEGEAHFTILKAAEWGAWRKGANDGKATWFKIYSGATNDYLFLSNVPVRATGRQTIPISGQNFHDLLRKYIKKETKPMNGKRKVTHSQNIAFPNHLKNDNFEEGSGKRKRIAVLIPATLTEVVKKEKEMGGQIINISDDGEMFIMESPKVLLDRYRAMARGKIVPVFSENDPLQTATILGRV